MKKYFFQITIFASVLLLKIVVSKDILDNRINGEISDENEYIRAINMNNAVSTQVYKKLGLG
jgi:hypothetical protein